MGGSAMRGKKGKIIRKRRRARRPGGNRAAMILITAVVCLLFVVLAYKDYQLNKRIEANMLRRAALEAEIEEERARTDTILKMRDYMESDEFIREKAKERLGLVDEEEIIFKAAE